MGRSAAMSDEQIDNVIQAIYEEGETPSVNSVNARCPVSRNRVQERLRLWQAKRSAEEIEQADIPQDVCDSLLQTIKQALSSVCLKERVRAKDEYSQRLKESQELQADISVTNKDLTIKLEQTSGELEQCLKDLDAARNATILEQGKVATLAEQIDEAREEIDAVKSELVLAQQKISGLESENKELTETKALLESSLNDALRASEKSQTMHDKETERRNAAEKRADTATEKERETATHLAVLQEQMRGITGEKDKLQEKVYTLGSMIKERDMQIANLTDELKQERIRNGELQKDLKVIFTQTTSEYERSEKQEQ